VGVDLSLGMLRVCARHGLTALRAEGGQLPFRSGSVDAVTAFSVVDHLVEPGRLFREALRVLKPGGFLYTDWDQNRAFPKPLVGVWMLAYRPLRTLAGGFRRRFLRDDLERSFELAEYHPFRGFLDGDALRDQLISLGFEPARVFYHANWGTPFDRGVATGDLAGLRQAPALRRILPLFMLLARKGG